MKHFDPSDIFVGLLLLPICFAIFKCVSLYQLSAAQLHERKNDVEVDGRITSLDFLQKKLHVGYHSNGGGERYAMCWVPVIGYEFSHEGSAFKGTYSPGERFIALNGYEELALFGNKDKPTEHFVNQIWAAHPNRAVKVYLKNGSADQSYLTYGEFQPSERRLFFVVATVVCLAAALFIIFYLATRLI